MTAIAKHYQVLIVGAGPCGVTAANLLGSYGIRTLIIDKEQAVVEIPRAIGMCEEGARIVNALGLYDTIISDMVPIDRVRFTTKCKRTIFHSDMNNTKNGYREQQTLYQPLLEAQLRKGLSRYDCVELRSGIECMQIQQTDHGAAAWLKELGGKRHKISCDYVMAADGARSTIRKMSGFGFAGKTYRQDWLILDVAKDPCPSSEIEFFYEAGRPGVTLPAPFGKRRWEFELAADDSHTEMLSDDMMRNLLSPWGRAEDMEVERKAIYSFHARTAQRFQNGRVFLMGDAAHITPPFAGQGMMAGMRDAYNLSWKIASVLQGKLAPKFLESYHRERRPQVHQIIAFARLVGSVILPKRAATIALRDSMFKAGEWLGLHSEKKGLGLKKLPSHINGPLIHHYIRSAISGLGVEVPQYPLRDAAGDYVLLDRELRGCFQLLSYRCNPLQYLSANTLSRWQRLGGGQVEIESSGGASLKDVDDSYRLLFKNRPSVIVVRPDKMMVLRSKPKHLDRDLNRYLDSISCSSAVAAGYLHGAY
tara:strand:+ start:191 stop:1792 length:1602 start_codon:yes stop_codon:yes gene_type:complete